MLHLILFFIFAAFCIGGAINLLVQKHPINSALSLIVVMASLALLYLLLGAEFVAAIQVIVYAGAVMVLFVFTIMLLNAGVEERTPHGSRVALMLGVPGLHRRTRHRRLGRLPQDRRSIRSPSADPRWPTEPRASARRKRSGICSFANSCCPSR